MKGLHSDSEHELFRMNCLIMFFVLLWKMSNVADSSQLTALASRNMNDEFSCSQLNTMKQREISFYLYAKKQGECD